MVDGSIRLGTKIDTDGALKDAKQLVKMLGGVAEKIKRTGKDAEINIDIKQAENSINKLDKDIERYQKKLNELNNGKLSEYNAQKTQIMQSTDNDLAQAKTDEQAKTILEMEQATLDQLDSKYQSVLSKAKEYTKQIEQAKQKQSELNQLIEVCKNPAEQVKYKFSSVKDAIAAAGREAREMKVEPFGTYAINGFYNMLGLFDRLKEKAKNTGQNIKDGMKNAFAFFQNGGISQIFQNVGNKIISFRDKINESISKAGEKFGELPFKARDSAVRAVAFFRNAFRNIKDTKLNIGTEELKAKIKKLTEDIKAKFKAVGNKVKDALHHPLKTTLSFAKKLGTSFLNVGKTISSKIGNGLKSALTRMKSLGKSADSMRKKVAKIGLALVGMRSVMAGFKQLVSSALANNEKLQKQMTAVKGVMGEALAPAINILVNGLSQMVSFADRLYQIFTGTSLIAKYNAKQAQKVADSTKDSADSAKEYKKQMAGFDVASALSDNTSNSSSKDSSDTDVALFEKADLSNWLNNIISQIKNGDWDGVGETIAGGINSALDKINWTSIQTKVNTFCTNLGKSVNGFVNALDWNNVGNSIGNGINTITSGINSFVDSVKWESVGAGISTGLNGIVNSINADELGKTLSAKLKVLTNTLYGFFNGDGKNGGFDFSKLGNKIGDTFNSWLNNIDWGKAASNISSAIKGLCDTISGAMDSINWNDGNDSVTAKIQEFFKNIDWAGMLKSACTALGKALGGLGSTIVQLLKDAWNEWKATYIDPAVDEAGGDIIAGVFNGIVNWLKDVGTWIKENILDPFIEGFKSTFDIHSPSKNPTILEIGRNIIEGVFNGVIDWLKGIGSWLKTNVFDKITEAWDGMKELTISIGGKLKNSFNNVKAKFDSIRDRTAEIVANAKEKTKNVFKNLKGKFDGIKNVTKTLTGNAKEKTKYVFSKLKKKFDNIKNITKTLTGQAKENAKAKFSSMKSKFESIKNKTATVTAEFKDKLTSAFKNVLQKAVDMINKVITAINKIPGINISKIPDIKLAKGGIVNVPRKGVQATIGEAGAEAVLPLENNTGWMDMLAEKLTSKMGADGTVQVIIYLDGRQIAQSINKFNNRQRIVLNGGV